MTSRGTSDPTVRRRRIELGAQLNSLRQQLGITVAEAARAIGVPQVKIVRIEQGEGTVSALELEGLLTLYGVTDNRERELVLTFRADQTEPSALPPEIAESAAVMALIERGRTEGQIAGDDVRRAFEADQIPATQWKNVLRSLNQVLEEEGVTLMVSAAEPRRTRKSVAANSPVMPRIRPVHPVVGAESPSDETAATIRGRRQRRQLPAELSALSTSEDAAAAILALITGIERIFQELGPPPDDLLDENGSGFTEGGGRQR